MAKGAERKTLLGVKPAPTAAAAPAPSAEEAERAASALVPMWQFDEAPFTASPEVAAEDLHALGSPVALQLAPSPVFGPAASVVAPEASTALDAGDIIEDAPAGDGGMMARATIRMAPPVTVHQPLPEYHAVDTALPSVIVEESVPAAPPPVAVAAPVEPLPSVVVAQPAPEPLVVVEPPPALPRLREPKTDPPMARRRPARPLPEPGPINAGDGYTVPRNRAPVFVGIGLAACAVLALVAFFVRSSSTSASQPSTTAPPPAAARPPTDQPAPIPPPPPPDETPAANAAPPAPTPPVAVAPTQPAPAPTPAPTTPRSGGRTSTGGTPPAQAGGWTPAPAPTRRPATPKNPSSTPAPHTIVRDNPF